MQVHVNCIDSQWDNRVVPLVTTWEIFRDFILQGHLQVDSEDRSAVKLFNAAEYRSVESLEGIPGALVYDDTPDKVFTRRLKANVLSVTMLVLDYDGGMQIEEARKRFEPFEYVGYTSFRHLKQAGVEKFRLVFPLASPIPAGATFTDCDDLVEGAAWYELADALKDFAGDCDPASFRCNQFYFLPITTRLREASAEVWSNSGTLLDWSQWKRLAPQRYVTRTTSASEDRRSTGHHLEPNQVLKSRRGSFRVRDVLNRVEGVSCPFHVDKNGSEFVKRLPSGDVFLYCRRCDKTYWMQREMPWAASSEPLLTMDGQGRHAEFTDASDRRRVNEQLKKIGQSIAKDVRPSKPGVPHQIDYPTHLVYLPEGSGKSALALELAASGQKILFACKSWNQAFEKFEWFKEKAKHRAHESRASSSAIDALGAEFCRPAEAPVNVELLLSKGAKALRLFGVDAVRISPKNPFDAGMIDDAASIQSFKNAKPELSEELIRLTWHLCSADKLIFGPEPSTIINGYDEVEEDVAGLQKFDTCDIIITTFAQARLLRLRNQQLPLNWTVWFDDPDVNDLSDIEPYEVERWGELNDTDQKAKRIIQRVASGQKYFTRDTRQSLGASVHHHRCVYTTTERVTLKAIDKLIRDRREYVILHDDMEAVVGGKITLLGTEKVYAAYDGIIPLMARRLEKDGHPVTLIADGLGQELNHSNTKGKNDLAQQNLVIEVSAPHPKKVQTICDTIGLSFQTERPEVTRDLVLDQLHQGLGRNSGYRFAGRECVALIPANLHSAILAEARYAYDRDNSVIIDRLSTMSQKDHRTTGGASSLVRAIEDFLNNFGRYVRDKRKIVPDINYVLGQISNENRREAYAARLMYAFTSLSGVVFCRASTSEEKSHPLFDEYFAAANSVLERFPLPSSRDRVLALYRRRLNEPKELEAEISQSAEID